MNPFYRMIDSTRESASEVERRWTEDYQERYGLTEGQMKRGEILETTGGMIPSMITSAATGGMSGLAVMGASAAEQAAAQAH